MQGFNMGRYHPPESLDASLSSTGKKDGGFNSQGHPLGKACQQNLLRYPRRTVRNAIRNVVYYVQARSADRARYQIQCGEKEGWQLLLNTDVEF